MPRLTFARKTALLGGAAALLFALSVYLGSGSRAADRCMGQFFVQDGEWSWTHLATRCEYGEPTQTGYAYSWASFFLLLALLGLAWTWMMSRRPGPGEASVARSR